MTLTGPPVMLSVSGLEALKILTVCGSFLRKFRIFSTVDCAVIELRASVAVMVTFLRSFHHILKFHFRRCTALVAAACLVLICRAAAYRYELAKCGRTKTSCAPGENQLLMGQISIPLRTRLAHARQYVRLS